MSVGNRSAGVGVAGAPTRQPELKTLPPKANPTALVSCITPTTEVRVEMFYTSFSARPVARQSPKQLGFAQFN